MSNSELKSGQSSKKSFTTTSKRSWTSDQLTLSPSLRSSKFLTISSILEDIGLNERFEPIEVKESKADDEQDHKEKKEKKHKEHKEKKDKKEKKEKKAKNDG